MDAKPTESLPPNYNNIIVVVAKKNKIVAVKFTVLCATVKMNLSKDDIYTNDGSAINGTCT